MTDEVSWIRPIYDVFALIGAPTAMYVMKKFSAEWNGKRHRHERCDPPKLHEARRIAFFIAASFLLLSVAYTDWQISVPVLLLVAANVTLLVINAVSYYLRPPSSRDGLRDRGYGTKYLTDYIFQYTEQRDDRSTDTTNHRADT